MKNSNLGLYCINSTPYHYTTLVFISQPSMDFHSTWISVFNFSPNRHLIFIEGYIKWITYITKNCQSSQKKYELVCLNHVKFWNPVREEPVGRGEGLCVHLFESYCALKAISARPEATLKITAAVKHFGISWVLAGKFIFFKEDVSESSRRQFFIWVFVWLFAHGDGIQCNDTNSAECVIHFALHC